MTLVKYITWLAQSSKEILSQLYSQTWWLSIQLHYFPTFFQELPGPEIKKYGYQVVFEFHSWSDKEEEMFDFDY
jgi:hypothetical protein